MNDTRPAWARWLDKIANAGNAGHPFYGNQWSEGKQIDRVGKVFRHETQASDEESMHSAGEAISKAHPGSHVLPSVTFGRVAMVRYNRPLRTGDIDEKTAEIGVHYKGGKKQPLPGPLMAKWNEWDRRRAFSGDK